MHARRQETEETKRACYSVREFCARYGIGPTSFYEQVKSGALKVHKLGTRTLIRHDDAEQWLRSLPSNVEDQPPKRNLATKSSSSP